MRKLIIGADGGATSTKLVATDDRGTVLGYGKCAGINYNYIGMDRSRQNLKDGVDRLLVDLGMPDYDHISIGHCALSDEATDEEKRLFCGHLFDPKMMTLHSDAHMTLYGTTLQNPGIVIVSGTGTMCVGRNIHNRTLTAGGWGFLLGDEGSSYYIAWCGILSAVRHFEGRGEHTAITEKLMQYCKISNMRDLINWLYVPSVDFSRIAGFAGYVVECAREGDNVAAEIVCRAVDALIETGSYLIKELDMTNGTIGIYGGLFEYNPDITETFSDKMKRLHPGFSIGFPEFSPELGAIIGYFISNGSLTDLIINTIRDTKTEARGGLS